MKSVYSTHVDLGAACLKVNFVKIGQFSKDNKLLLVHHECTTNHDWQKLHKSEMYRYKYSISGKPTTTIIR